MDLSRRVWVFWISGRKRLMNRRSFLKRTLGLGSAAIVAVKMPFLAKKPEPESIRINKDDEWGYLKYLHDEAIKVLQCQEDEIGFAAMKAASTIVF